MEEVSSWILTSHQRTASFQGDCGNKKQNKTKGEMKKKKKKMKKKRKKKKKKKKKK